jgi:hypothetical protein
MGSILGKIAKIGTSFIPGAGPLISGGIGAAMSAFGGSGNQGGMNGTSSQNSSQNIDQTTTQSEDPYFSAFRKAITGQIGEGLQRADKPAYGDTEKASVLSDINDLTQSSIASLRRHLGGTGGLSSGRLAAGVGDATNERNSQASKFLAQIPLMNRQYSDNQRNQLLQLGAGFAGPALRSTHTTGTTTGKTDGSFSQQQQGPSFLKGLMGNLGGLGAYDSGSGGPLSQIFGNLFKGKAGNGGFNPYGDGLS